MITSFFDFYLANLLFDFNTRKDHIYFGCKLDRIEDVRNRINDSFYNKVRDSLHYAVLREFRHIDDYFIYDGDNTKEYDGIYKKYRLTIRRIEKVVEKHYYNQLASDKDIKDVINLKIDLVDVYKMFHAHKYWETDFGGKLWAKATEFLLNLPKNDKEKIVWVDRVLDLYHNSGPLLNKTEFKILFKPKTCGEKLMKRTALNYRRYAKAADLAKYSSVSLRKLFIANRRSLPENI